MCITTAVSSILIAHRRWTQQHPEIAFYSRFLSHMKLWVTTSHGSPIQISDSGSRGSSCEHVVLTHPNLDHVAGLSDVMRRYDVKRVLEREIEHDFLTAVGGDNLRPRREAGGEDIQDVFRIGDVVKGVKA